MSATDRAPRPEGMTDDLDALTAAMKADCNEHVNGQCHTLACYKRGGYQGFGPATAFTPTCQAKQVLSLIEECRRLRADGATLREELASVTNTLREIRAQQKEDFKRADIAEAEAATLRERVRKLPTPLFCSTNKCQCDWCGVEFGHEQQHPMNDCLYAELWAAEIAADANARRRRRP